MKETCYVCLRRGDFKHLERFICKKCFLRNIEKRVRKHLKEKGLKKGERVLVIGELEKFLLEKAKKDLPLEIVFKEKLPSSLKGYGLVVIGRTKEEINEDFLEGLFKGELRLGEIRKNFFNILEVLTIDEAERYARLRRIKFKKRKIKGILNSLKRFKEVNYTLYKNIKELRELKELKNLKK